VGESISRVVDFDQSEAKCRTTVASDVDPQLDSMKRTYDGMETLLARIVQEMNGEPSNSTRATIDRCIFYPQLGFLTEVQLKSEAGDRPYLDVDQNGDEWEKMFTAHGSVYYKNRQMRELDDHFGDIYGAIVGKLMQRRYE
jgi:DNA mismatch repair protein MSH5